MPNIGYMMVNSKYYKDNAIKRYQWNDKNISVLSARYNIPNEVSKTFRIRPETMENVSGFSNVAYAVNGAASYAIPELLNLLNCNVIPLFCSPDGKFPHSPEPLNKNLTILCDSVVQNKADLGIAIDPDGDRLAIIDDKGKKTVLAV